MNTVVKQLADQSKVTRSNNGWHYLLIPCEGFEKPIVAKTSRKIEECLNHFEALKITFPNKQY